MLPQQVRAATAQPISTPLCYGNSPVFTVHVHSCSFTQFFTEHNCARTHAGLVYMYTFSVPHEHKFTLECSYYDCKGYVLFKCFSFYLKSEEKTLFCPYICCVYIYVIIISSSCLYRENFKLYILAAYRYLTSGSVRLSVYACST